MEFWLWLSCWEEVLDHVVPGRYVRWADRVHFDFLRPIRAFRITCFAHWLDNVTWSCWRCILLLEKLSWDWRLGRDPCLWDLRRFFQLFRFSDINCIVRFFGNGLRTFFRAFHYDRFKHLDFSLRILDRCLFRTLSWSLLFKNLKHCLMLLHPFLLVFLILVLFLYCLLRVVDLAWLVSFLKELLLLINFFLLVLIILQNRHNWLLFPFIGFRNICRWLRWNPHNFYLFCKVRFAYLICIIHTWSLSYTVILQFWIWLREILLNFYLIFNSFFNLCHHLHSLVSWGKFPEASIFFFLLAVRVVFSQETLALMQPINFFEVVSGILLLDRSFALIKHLVEELVKLCTLGV